MYEFRDLSRLTLVASVFVGAHAFFYILASGGALVEGPPGADEFRSADAFLLISFLLLICSFVVVGRWIYRASANAHALGGEMTITPGWAVGWYFVPFANLVKPLQAMREIWQASHESTGAYEERVPILALWWGLWITTNILANIGWRLGDLGVGPTIDMIGAALNIPLCVILIIIMRDIDSSQRYARHALTFA